MPTTSNFGWTTPADTDLVKDGAAAIRTLGNGVDASLVDLKGGTTGQVLSKATNTDLDYTWITPNVGDITEVQAGTGISVASGTGPIPVITNTVATAFDAAGDLVYGTGADTFAKLGIGTAGQVLKVNSGATAPEWGASATGALTKITANTFSSVATVDIQDCFSSTYLYYLVFVDVEPASFGGSFEMQFLYSTSSVQNTGYYASSFQYDRANTLTTSGTVNQASAKLLTYTGGSGSPSGLSFTITNVGNSSELPLYWGNSVNWSQAIQSFAGGYTGTARTYTGLRFFDSANNITGNYKVYGVQN